MLTPYPHQIEGAIFLARRQKGGLFDEQRVGKTGASIRACDYAAARTILVLTTSTARANWARDMAIWGYKRKIQIIFSKKDKVDPTADVVIIGWGMIHDKELLVQLRSRMWDAFIIDESHKAKNPETKTTKAVYDMPGLKEPGLTRFAKYVFDLSGTYIPNTPIDTYPRLLALAPELLKADPDKGWPDVSNYDAFLRRYCVVRRKKLNWNWIDVPISGKNEEELRERMRPFMMRRTQKDVGIRPPQFSNFYIKTSALQDRQIRAALNDLGGDVSEMLDALDLGVELPEEDWNVASLRRVTGQIKAQAVIEAVKEAFSNGLDKVVLMAWHTDVIDALRAGLAEYGVASIDGRTPGDKRFAQEQAFQTDKNIRVFVGQIIAAGEAIDLSASAELWFVELSFVPKDMSQAAMRITNHTQMRQALIRVCVLADTIDEGLTDVLTRKVRSIKILQEK